MEKQKSLFGQKQLITTYDINYIKNEIDLSKENIIRIKSNTINDILYDIFINIGLNIHFDVKESDFERYKKEVLTYVAGIKNRYIFIFEKREQLLFNNLDNISVLFDIIINIIYESQKFYFIFIVSEKVKLLGTSTGITYVDKLLSEQKKIINTYYVSMKFSVGSDLKKTMIQMIYEKDISLKNINLDALEDVLSDENFFTPRPTVITINKKILSDDLLFKIIKIFSDLRREIPLYLVIE